MPDHAPVRGHGLAREADGDLQVGLHQFLWDRVWACGEAVVGLSGGLRRALRLLESCDGLGWLSAGSGGGERLGVGEGNGLIVGGKGRGL